MALCNLGLTCIAVSSAAAQTRPTTSTDAHDQTIVSKSLVDVFQPKEGGPEGSLSVDLIWSPVPDFTDLGGTIEIQLLARSSSETESVAIGAIDLIFAWDPAVLELIEVADDGPYNWLIIGLPDDSGLDGLNDDLTDGEGFFQALSSFGTPAMATPEGLHVATFRFEGLQLSSGTILSMPEESGDFTVSRVLGTEVGLVLTGELDSVALRVCPDVPFDADEDGDVDLVDFGEFQLCFTGPTMSATPQCLVFDFDCDADVDLVDFGQFQLKFTGPL
jgi:hypothetical protein